MKPTLVPILYESQHQVSSCFTQGFTQEPKVCFEVDAEEQTAMKGFFWSAQNQEATNTQPNYQLSTLVARTLPIWYELRQYQAYTHTNLIRTSWGNTNHLYPFYMSLNMLHSSQISALDSIYQHQTAMKVFKSTQYQSVPADMHHPQNAHYYSVVDYEP